MIGKRAATFILFFGFAGLWWWTAESLGEDRAVQTAAERREQKALSEEGTEREPRELSAGVSGREARTPSGALLVGFRTDARSEPLHGPSAYRTIWLDVSEGAKASALTFDRVIAAPRGEELWLLQPVLVDTPTDTIQYIAAHRAAEPTVAKSIEDDPAENVVLFERIGYVGENLISLEAEGEYWAGNRPAGRSIPWVKSFDQLGQNEWYSDYGAFLQDDRHIRIGDVYGEAIDGFVQAFGDTQGDELAYELPTGDHWRIVRKEGAWRAELAAPLAYPLSGYVTAEVPHSVSEPVQGGSRPADLRLVRQAFPEATDAFLSPSGDALLVVSPGSVRLFASDDDGRPLGDPLWSEELTERESVVLCRWFVEEERKVWKERVEGVHATLNFGYPGYADKPTYGPIEPETGLRRQGAGLQ